MTMVRLFGGTELQGDHLEVLRGRQQARLLVMLCYEAPGRVSRVRLEDEVWNGRPISDAALRVTLRRLRCRFTAAGLGDPVVAEAGGWRLMLEPSEIDLWGFEHLVQQARTAWSHGRAEAASAAGAEAMDLWRGEPLEDTADLPSAVTWTERLWRLKTDLAVIRMESALVRGAPAEALELLAASDELGHSARYREDLTELRMLASALTGRRDLARHAFMELTEALWDDIGVSPGRSIAELDSLIDADDHNALERRVQEISSRVGHVTVASTSIEPGPSVEIPTPASFVGRAELLDEIEEAHRLGEIVVLRGAAGMGKSRISHRICESARARGAAAIMTSVSPLESGPEAILLPLCDLEERSGSTTLRDLLESSTAPGGIEVRSPRVRDRVAALLGGLGENAVVVMEDIHWMDRNAAQVTWHLISRCKGVSWILTTRPAPLSEGATELLSQIRGTGRIGSRELDVDAMCDADCAELVQLISGGALDESTVGEVVAQCGGWPLLGVQLAHHLIEGGSLDDAPTSVADRVDTLLGGLGRAERDALELLAVTESPLTTGELGAAMDLGRERSGDVVSALGGSGLVRVESGTAEVAHELIRRTIVGQCDARHLEALHLRVAEVLSSRRSGQEALVVRHLMAAGPDAHELLERALGRALVAMIRLGAYDDAAALALEFLDHHGAEATTTDGLFSRVQVCSVLLLTGRTEAGLAVYDAVAAPIRRLGDPLLRAEAVLARGPLDVGSPRAEDLIAEAVELLDLLAEDAVAQRVQLCCWLVHHRLTVADRNPTECASGTGRPAGPSSDDLLAQAEALTAETGDPHLRGLVLGVGYQATTAVQRETRDAEAAFDRLSRWRSVTTAVSAEAMERLFALDRAATGGSLAQHGLAVDELAAFAPSFPRPDVRWYVEAARAGALLAEGRFADAADQVQHAAEVGAQSNLPAAAAMERVHQFLLLEGQGLLAATAPMFDGTGDSDPPLEVALAGLVGTESGDAGRATWAAEVLCAAASPLERAGASWPLLAHVMAELAARTGDAGLGRLLVASLEHRAGTGFSMLGLALFGSVDRVLGLAHAASGGPAGAISHLCEAAERDRANEMVHWAGVADGHLERFASMPTGDPTQRPESP